MQELTRAYGPQFGAVLDRVYRYLILSATTYLLFTLVPIVLIRTPGGAQISTATAIGLGVLSNLATSLLTLAATRLVHTRTRGHPAQGSG